MILSALPEWQVDFEQMPAGQPPSTAPATPGMINSQPTAIFEGGDGRLEVVESFQAGAAVMDSKALLLSFRSRDLNPDNMAMVNFQGHDQDVLPPEDFVIWFDFLVDSLSVEGSGTNTLEVRIRNAAEEDQMLRILFETRGDIRLLSDSVYEVDTTFENAWSMDTLHRVEGQFDADQSTFTLSVDGETLGDVVFNFQDDSEKSVRTVVFRFGSAGLGFDAAIANFHLHPPQPHQSD